MVDFRFCKRFIKSNVNLEFLFNFGINLRLLRYERLAS